MAEGGARPLCVGGRRSLGRACWLIGLVASREEIVVHAGERYVGRGVSGLTTLMLRFSVSFCMSPLIMRRSSKIAI